MIDILKSFASHRSVLLQKKKKTKNLPLALHAREKFELDLWTSLLQMITGKCADRKGLNSIFGAQFTALWFLHLSALRHHCRYFVSLLNRRNKSFYWLSLFNEMTRYGPCFFCVFIDRNVSLAWSSVTIIFDTTGSKIVKKSKCTLSLITMKKELPLKLFFRYNDKVATVCLSI